MTPVKGEPSTFLVDNGATFDSSQFATILLRVHNLCGAFK